MLGSIRHTDPHSSRLSLACLFPIRHVCIQPYRPIYHAHIPFAFLLAMCTHPAFSTLICYAHILGVVDGNGIYE